MGYLRRYKAYLVCPDCECKNQGWESCGGYYKVRCRRCKAWKFLMEGDAKFYHSRKKHDHAGVA
jgi:hypothetical protein